MADLSPMLKQYMEMKKKEPNTILFFRLGDFYEMFFDDAKLVSRELDLTLTGRGCVGKCRSGPNISIDGEEFERVDSESLIDLLDAKLRGQES